MKPRWFRIAHGWLKAVCILAGFAVTVLSLMAVVGALTANGWVRVIVAIVVALAIPALIADRLRPKDDPIGALGLPSDIYAVFLLGLAVAFLAVPRMRPLLLREADRETTGGAATVARMTYFLAGVRPTNTVEESPSPTASSSESSSPPAPPPSPAPPRTDGGLAGAGADASTAKPPERSPADLFRDLAPTVVTIMGKEADGEGGGTGFLLDDQGTVATNHHVVEGAREVRIKLFSGTWVENDDIEVLDDNRTDDLVLMRIHTKEKLKAVDLGDSDGVTVGEHVISIGNPLGLEDTLTDGLVSARRMYEGRQFIQMSAPVSPGNSGGPLFNMQGQVIGITTAQVAGGLFGRAQNLNLAVPINTLKPMIQSDYPKRHRLGKDGSNPGTW